MEETGKANGKGMGWNSGGIEPGNWEECPNKIDNFTFSYKVPPFYNFL